MIQGRGIQETGNHLEHEGGDQENDAGSMYGCGGQKSDQEGNLFAECRIRVGISFLVVAFILCVIFLRSVTVPARGSFRGQLEILSNLNRARTHTWNRTITYICSFGSFSGSCGRLSDNDQDHLRRFRRRWIHWRTPIFGPLIGGLVRAISGGLFDKIGGSKGMHWTTLGQIGGCLALVFGGFRHPPVSKQFQGFLGHALDIPDDRHEQRGDFPPVPDRVRSHSPAKGAQMLG